MPNGRLFSRENGRFTVTKMTGYLITYSYSHLLVITGYKWDYTFYKWGFLVLITGITWAITVIKHRVVPSKSGLTWDAHCAVRAEVLREARAWADSGTPKENWGLWLDFKGGLMINVY